MLKKQCAYKIRFQINSKLSRNHSNQKFKMMVETQDIFGIYNISLEWLKVQDMLYKLMVKVQNMLYTLTKTSNLKLTQ